MMYKETVKQFAGLVAEVDVEIIETLEVADAQSGQHAGSFASP